MKAKINVDDFIEAVKLPEGIKFHEWTTEPPRIVPVDGRNEPFVLTQEMALESADGRLAKFEICRPFPIRKEESGRIMIEASDLALAVDKAIAELEAK